MLTVRDSSPMVQSNWPIDPLAIIKFRESGQLGASGCREFLLDAKSVTDTIRGML
jgi:hypothetical protein